LLRTNIRRVSPSVDANVLLGLRPTNRRISLGLGPMNRHISLGLGPMNRHISLGLGPMNRHHSVGLAPIKGQFSLRSAPNIGFQPYKLSDFSVSESTKKRQKKTRRQATPVGRNKERKIPMQNLRKNSVEALNLKNKYNAATCSERDLNIKTTP
jgi:hypothetical protein